MCTRLFYQLYFLVQHLVLLPLKPLLYPHINMHTTNHSYVVKLSKNVLFTLVCSARELLVTSLNCTDSSRYCYQSRLQHLPLQRTRLQKKMLLHCTLSLTVTTFIIICVSIYELLIWLAGAYSDNLSTFSFLLHTLFDIL